MVVAGISDPFAGYGPAAKAKFILLGSSDFNQNLMDRVRSLNIEHVSPFRLKRPEISRRTATAAAEEGNSMTLVRHWFFTRKPDAGFILTDFPATLLQAKVFDEWLDARNEALSAVIAGLGSSSAIIQHYRTLGLINEAGALTSS